MKTYLIILCLFLFCILSNRGECGTKTQNRLGIVVGAGMAVDYLSLQTSQAPRATYPFGLEAGVVKNDISLLLDWSHFADRSPISADIGTRQINDAVDLWLRRNIHSGLYVGTAIGTEHDVIETDALGTQVTNQTFWDPQLAIGLGWMHTILRGLFIDASLNYFFAPQFPENQFPQFGARLGWVFD